MRIRQPGSKCSENHDSIRILKLNNGNFRIQIFCICQHCIFRNKKGVKILISYISWELRPYTMTLPTFPKTYPEISQLQIKCESPINWDWRIMDPTGYGKLKIIFLNVLQRFQYTVPLYCEVSSVPRSTSVKIPNNLF